MESAQAISVNELVLASYHALLAHSLLCKEALALALSPGTFWTSPQKGIIASSALKDASIVTVNRLAPVCEIITRYCKAKKRTLDTLRVSDLRKIESLLS